MIRIRYFFPFIPNRLSVLVSTLFLNNWSRACVISPATCPRSLTWPRSGGGAAQVGGAVGESHQREHSVQPGLGGGGQLSEQPQLQHAQHRAGGASPGKDFSPGRRRRHGGEWGRWGEVVWLSTVDSTAVGPHVFLSHVSPFKVPAAGESGSQPNRLPAIGFVPLCACVLHGSL